MTISSLISPSQNYLSSLNIPLSLPYEELRIQYLSFSVYYSQLEYTLIQETPAVTLPNLIASIGGSMGLIVGISFFTILEVSELFVLLLHAFIYRHFNSNKVSF